MASRSAKAQPKPREDLLSIVKAEREQSVGFNIDPLLLAERTKALDYYKGVMKDMPTQENRSKAVSTDVADVIQTLLPDLIDIFTGGDDVVSFIPTSQEDEVPAQQETEFLHKVFFEDNPGFLILLTVIIDALLTKTGVVKWWWEAVSVEPAETFEGQTLLAVAMAAKDGPIENITFGGEPYQVGQPLPQGAETAPLWNFDLKGEGPTGRLRAQAIPSEDFTVAKDTVRLADATYCAWRSRPRRQQLIADGHDAAIVDRLPVHSLEENETIKRARDTAGENTYNVGGGAPNRDLETVEIVEHFVQVLSADNELELWCVLTGSDETILIDADKVDRLRIAAITPFIVPHRFYGESVADKTIGGQQVKTALLRAFLDSIYFALNARHFFPESSCTENTLSDYVDNRPGVPIRGKGDAPTPLNNAQPTIPYQEALEYMSTVIEQRTGVVRNAQGLNPDTLHDTATGALALMGMAQRRTRMIARTFAETGIKDMFLGIHAEIRTHATTSQQAMLKGKWQTVDPTQWAERNDMKIEIGVGAGGAQQKLGALTQVITLQGEMAKGPGAMLVTPENAYRAVVDAAKSAGLKTPEEYFTDPATLPPAAPAAPSLEALKVQADQQSDAAKLQLEQGKLAVAQSKLQLEQGKLQFEAEDAVADRQQKMELAQLEDKRETARLTAEHEREVMRLQAEMQIKQAELALKAQESAAKAAYEREKLQGENAVALLEARIKASTAIDVAQIGAGVKREAIQGDLAIQESESDDVHLMAHHDREHELGMAVVTHTLGEAAKDADVERQPDPELQATDGEGVE